MTRPRRRLLLTILAAAGALARMTREMLAPGWRPLCALVGLAGFGCASAGPCDAVGGQAWEKSYEVHKLFERAEVQFVVLEHSVEASVGEDTRSAATLEKAVGWAKNFATIPSGTAAVMFTKFGKPKRRLDAIAEQLITELRCRRAILICSWSAGAVIAYDSDTAGA